MMTDVTTRLIIQALGFSLSPPNFKITLEFSPCVLDFVLLRVEEKWRERERRRGRRHFSTCNFVRAFIPPKKGGEERRISFCMREGEIFPEHAAAAEAERSIELLRIIPIALLGNAMER